ncbi:hypothetical protein GCM10023065_31500 [Microbacterium laevaniformans]
MGDHLRLGTRDEHPGPDAQFQMAERCDADEVLERLPRRTAADELVERRGIVRSPIAAQSSGEHFTPRKGEHMGGEQLGIDVGVGTPAAARVADAARSSADRSAGGPETGGEVISFSTLAASARTRRGAPHPPTVKIRHIRLGIQATLRLVRHADEGAHERATRRHPPRTKGKPCPASTPTSRAHSATPHWCA